MTQGCRRFFWVWTLFGLIFSLVDIGSDLLLSIQFYRKGQISWFVLTLCFTFIGSICMQIFSFTWFRDDAKKNVTDISLSTACLVVLHLLHLGFYTRYFLLLKKSFRPVWCSKSKCGQKSKPEYDLYNLRSDLSMLRLFETFLESVPQLLLQLYIYLEYQHGSTLQYISMAVSFLSTAWTMVDFWRCLRDSLPDNTKLASFFSVFVYLLYKIFTITARILSLALFILLNVFSVVAMAFIWLVATVWVHVLQTNFCTSLCMEGLYRSIVGVILVFTFFNVKGKNTKIPMTVYYILTTLQNLSAPILLSIFKPRIKATEFFFPIALFILGANVLGLAFLVMYYALIHRKPAEKRIADEVDGLAPSKEQEEPCKEHSRLDKFINF